MPSISYSQYTQGNVELLKKDEEISKLQDKLSTALANEQALLAQVQQLKQQTVEHLLKQQNISKQVLENKGLGESAKPNEGIYNFQGDMLKLQSQNEQLKRQVEDLIKEREEQSKGGTNPSGANSKPNLANMSEIFIEASLNSDQNKLKLQELQSAKLKRENEVLSQEVASLRLQLDGVKVPHSSGAVEKDLRIEALTKDVAKLRNILATSIIDAHPTNTATNTVKPNTTSTTSTTGTKNTANTANTENTANTADGINGLNLTTEPSTTSTGAFVSSSAKSYSGEITELQNKLAYLTKAIEVMRDTSPLLEATEKKKGIEIDVERAKEEVQRFTARIQELNLQHNKDEEEKGQLRKRVEELTAEKVEQNYSIFGKLLARAPSANKGEQGDTIDRNVHEAALEMMRVIQREQTERIGRELGEERFRHQETARQLQEVSKKLQEIEQHRLSVKGLAPPEIEKLREAATVALTQVETERQTLEQEREAHLMTHSLLREERTRFGKEKEILEEHIIYSIVTLFNAVDHSYKLQL